MPLQQNEGINRNHEKYGEYGKYAFRIRDGICFTYMKAEGMISEDGDRRKGKSRYRICVLHYVYERIRYD